MTQKLKLWFFSLILLFINIALLFGVGFNYFNGRSSANSTDQAVLGVSANAPVYNPNYVMSNETFRSKRVFGSQESIQNYLNNVNSPLKNYQVNGKSAASWIFTAANGQTSSRFGIRPDINPAVLIAYLEKEQSLISLSNYNTVTDPEKRLKTALGYGCPDTAACDSKFFGLDNQLNWAAYQLEYNFALASGNNSSEAYRVNRTITTLDGYKVFLSNAATAANYRYTPHAYFGNYNLWKIITANGWGVDSNTYSTAYIDQINISRIETKDGVENPALSEADVATVLQRKYNIGHSGGDVILLQRFLRQRGFFTYDSITGYYGTVTQAAHQNYLNSKNPAAPQVNVPAKPSCDDLTKRNYSIGQTDDTVKALQECLRASGHFKHPTSTGYYGSITEKAKTDFLNSQKKTVVATPAPVPVISVDPCETFKSRSFRVNETSQDVLKLQQCMRKAGVFTWPFDTGFFGPVTQEAFSKYKGSSTPNFSCGNLKGQEYRLGETSERVKQLQACMRAAGVFSHPSNSGFFGQVTKASLIKWRGYF
jgi:peptidoglycan hydrolase-like protein with peptidoglycan-binding domain